MSSRFFTCSVPECGRPNIRGGAGGCDLCNRYLCRIHTTSHFHECDTAQVMDDKTYDFLMSAEIEHLCSQINFEAVCKLASSLNDGRGCTIEQSTKSFAGSLVGWDNCHARILFDDGSRSWLLRVPRITCVSTALPPTLVDYLVLSEYSTLKFLETTKVPTPRAFGYGISGSGKDHGVSVSFILMEELPGTPWNGGTDYVTDEERAKVWGDLADILLELRKHPFPKAGSLCSQSSGIEVSTHASDRFLALSPSGPFTTSTAYYKAFAEHYLEIIADSQLYTQYPVNAYLVYRFMKDNVPPTSLRRRKANSGEVLPEAHRRQRRPHTC